MEVTLGLARRAALLEVGRMKLGVSVDESGIRLLIVLRRGSGRLVIGFMSPRCVICVPVNSRFFGEMLGKVFGSSGSIKSCGGEVVLKKVEGGWETRCE